MKPKAAISRALVGGAAYCAAASLLLLPLLLLPLLLLLPSSGVCEALLSTPRPSAQQAAPLEGEGGQGEE